MNKKTIITSLLTVVTLTMTAQEKLTPTTEEKVYDCGEVMPYFPGGDRALLEFVKNNLRYPDLAIEYGVKGRVIMTFKVDTIGQVSNIKPAKFLLRYDTLYMNRVPTGQQIALKQQIDSLLSKECIRVISLMPRWTPGSLFGETVSVKYNLPVQFNATDAERQTYFAQKNVQIREVKVTPKKERESVPTSTSRNGTTTGRSL